MLWLSCPVSATGVPCHWRQGAFIFPLPSSSHWPRWLSLKDALSLPEGAVILHSPLWWTMQLDWGSLLCVPCKSVCECCHCTVCWNNSRIRMSLRMKRRNLSRFTSRSSSGASAFFCCYSDGSNHVALLLMIWDFRVFKCFTLVVDVKLDYEW